jgi:hypothetical protein
MNPLPTFRTPHPPLHPSTEYHLPTGKRNSCSAPIQVFTTTRYSAEPHTRIPPGSPLQRTPPLPKSEDTIFLQFSHLSTHPSHTHTRFLSTCTLPQIVLSQYAPSRNAHVRNIHISPHYKNPHPTRTTSPTGTRNTLSHISPRRVSYNKLRTRQQLQSQPSRRYFHQATATNTNIPTLLRRLSLLTLSLGFSAAHRSFTAHGCPTYNAPACITTYFYMFTPVALSTVRIDDI